LGFYYLVLITYTTLKHQFVIVSVNSLQSSSQSCLTYSVSRLAVVRLHVRPVSKMGEKKSTVDLSMVAHEDDADERGSAEAGAVRGLARSVQTMGRQAVKLPTLGRLPAQAPRMPAPRPRSSGTRIPVKQVAKISDRISTGWDLWDTASETGAWKWSNIRPFVVCEYMREDCCHGVSH
jgi:hypothetical protein